MYHPGFPYSLNPLKKYNHFTKSREASKPNEIKILEYLLWKILRMMHHPILHVVKQAQKHDTNTMLFIDGIRFFWCSAMVLSFPNLF